MPPSENAIVRHVDEPGWQRIPRFNARDYPLIFAVYELASNCPYLPQGFKDYLYDQRRFSDNTLYRLSARFQTAITENDARGFPDGTAPPARCLALIRWLYLHQESFKKLYCERDAVRKLLNQHKLPLTRANLLRMKIATEISLPMKGYSRRWKYYNHQVANEKLVCPICYDKDDHMKIILESITNFHDHMTSHGQIDIYGCHKCHRIYQEKADYEIHVCKSGQPKEQEFPTVIYAIACCECGFAARYDIQDVRRAAAIMAKFKKILLNHNSQQLVVIKLATTHPKGEVEGEENMSWTGQMKLKVRRARQGGCNLPGCKGLKLEDDRAFRRHLCTHMKANRVPFIFSQFLKNYLEPTFVDVPGISLHRQFLNQYQDKTGNPIFNLTGEDAQEPEDEPEDEPIIQELPHFPEYEHTESETDGEQFVGGLRPTNWIEEYKDTVPFKVRFEDPLPGVANSTSRIFLCKKCYLITFGNSATMSHIKNCQNIQELNFTKQVIFSSEYVWQLGQFNHLPNELIPCVVESCKVTLCSIQGFVVHFADKHGFVANIDYNSAGGYGSEHRESWRDRDSYLVQEVNQFCGLSKGGDLPLDTATNEAEAQYSEEILAMQEDVDLSWLEEVEPPYEFPEESDEELEPRDFYPKRTTVPQNGEGIELDQPEVQVVPTEVKIYPGMKIQLEQAPMSVDTVANGLVSPDQSSGTDSMSPNESNQPKVPSLKLRLGRSLSTDVLEANGMTANDDLPDDYQKRKERKDEKRRQKRERRLQSASDKPEEERRSVALARETARMEREADGREMEKRRKKKQEELAKKAKEAEIWKRVSEDVAAGAVQEGERNAEGEGRQQTIEINFGNRCFDCGLEFNTDQMKEHYRRHRFFSTRRPDTFLITCHHCLLSFKELKEFLSHVVFTHSKENPDKDNPKKRICNDCARPYTNEAFVNHSRYECYMMKKCGQCGEDMERMRHAEKTAHMNQKHRDAKRFWCNCSSGSSTGKSSFASIIDFDNHTCSVKQLAEITMSEDLLMGAKVDSAFTLGVINGSSKRAKFEAPVEKSSPALRQILDARPPGDAAVLRKMLEAPAAVSRVRSEEPLEGERRRRKRKASEPTEAERTNTLAHQAIVASQLATSVQSTLSLEDAPLQIVEDEPSTSTAAPQPAGSSTAAPEPPGTSAGSSQTSGILSQALKEAGIPTASTEVRSPPPADQEPGTSREKAKKEVRPPCKDVKAARPTPADAYIANMPSTSSAPVNGTDDNFSTTATIAADDNDDDEIICLDSPRPGTSTDPDVEFLAPAPHVSAPAILNEDGDIMEVEIMDTDGSAAPRPARAAKFPCDICQKAFKTRRAMHDHRDLDHHRDICSLDRHLTQNVYGIPYRGTSYLCTHCVMVFETGHRHAQHMEFHRELGTEILLCDFCSVQALSHEGMQKHLLHHGIDVRNPNRRQPIQIENWCTLCTPMLSFPSDAGYYLHVMETHHCPIFFFCKNCLVGSCDDNVIWNHIMSGRCTEKRVYERTIGFAIASDLHFQPTDEGVHLQKLRETPTEFVKPHTCTSRSFVKYHNKNATCEEVEREGDTDKCHSLINFFAFENRMCQQLNYHVADSGSIPKEQLPDHRFCNLEYNLYRWLDSKFHHSQRIPLNIESERGDQIQPSLPPPQLPYPQPPVGRGVTNQQQRGQPRTTPPTRPSAGPSALVNQLSRQSSRSRSGASPAGVGQTPRHSTSSASSRGPPEVVQLRPQHSVFQRITLPTVSDPESRVRHVEDQLGINSRRIAMEAQQGHQVGQLRVRQAELTAMLGRLTHQINLERQHGPRMPQFQMDVPAADVPYYAAEMIPPLAAVAPRPAAAHPLMALQLEASRQAAPQAAEVLPPPPEILRPVHQNQQVVQPRPEVRRPGDTVMGTCAVCDGQLSAKFLVRLMGKTEDYVTVILTSAAHLSVGLLTGIRQRMTRNNSVCFQHVNPHAVSVINSNTFVVSNHQQASMLTYNYVEYAYPALDKVAYAVTLQQLYAQLDSEQITHQQFINLLKAANRCRETSCKNSPLSNMSAAKLHGHHVAGLRMMGQLLCSHCWKCFSNETDIVAHMMAEHSRANQHGRVQFDLRCPVPNCAVGFDNPSNLQAHLSTQHRAMFSHTSMCNQPFATEEAKASHDATHRRCGSGRCCSLCGIGSPFEGVLCGRFNNLSHYHRHACVVRYTCKVCMEGFEKHSQLLSHCRRYHNIGGSDPLHCQFCRKNLNADEVTTHINGEHELLLFAVNQLAAPQITCPPEMNEFLGLSATR